MNNLDPHAIIASRVRATQTSFYWPMRLQRSRFRRALFAIYIYCRALDDLADNNSAETDKIRALNAWKDKIEILFSSHSSELDLGNPLLATLADTISEFNLEKEPFLDLIDGVEIDVNGPVIAPNWEALSIYCQKVAASVGTLCLSVWGWRGTQAERFTQLSGEALQLTNILRDIKEDSIAGRLYLPIEALVDAKINTRIPSEVLKHPALENACAPLINRTRTRFEQARECWKESSIAQARPAWVMLELYRALFLEVIRTGFNPDGPKTKLTRRRKLFHLTRAYITA